MPETTAHQHLRPLGAFERIIDLYTHRNPVQFSLAAELVRDVSQDELTLALHGLQRVHPLLAAEVDRAGDAFRHSASAIPVRVAPGSTWRHEVAVEQTTAIEHLPGPLARVVLIPADGTGSGSTIVVTFAHQITDGRGSLRAVQDLVTILAGRGLAPLDLPSAQEDLLAGLPTEGDGPSVDPAPDGDATPPSPGRLRPFDGALPEVEAGDLDGAATQALLDRSRAESSTVQAALCAAAATVLSAATGRDQVRINVPVDLRGAVGLEDDVVVRFGATMVVLDEVAGTSFWDLARAATAQLQAARDPELLRASALMLAQLAPSTADEAEAAMLAATTADVEITNLGVADGSDADQDVRRLWGPTMTTQVAGEQILGVVTHGGVFRMVNVAHDPVVGLVDGMRHELEQATRP